MLVRSLPPVVSPATRVLILGSMPGVESLNRGRYYAHPRNRFWPLMGILCEAGPDLPYEERLDRLLRSGLGLWDVIGECRRSGSSDGAIVRGTEIPNDLRGLMARVGGIEAVGLNGRKAAHAFRRLVLPALQPDVADRLELLELPSTSPANASRSLGSLLEEWAAVGAHLDAWPRGSHS